MPISSKQLNSTYSKTPVFPGAVTPQQKPIGSKFISHFSSLGGTIIPPPAQPDRRLTVLVLPLLETMPQYNHTRTFTGRSLLWSSCDASGSTLILRFDVNRLILSVTKLEYSIELVNRHLLNEILIHGLVIGSQRRTRLQNRVSSGVGMSVIQWSWMRRATQLLEQKLYRRSNCERWYSIHILAGFLFFTGFGSTSASGTH